MRRVMLRVAYDGTNYCGWQVQPNGNTIEAELNKALTDLTKEPVEVTGASRTDSGVHAFGNVAVFDTNMKMPGEKFSYALNTRLPEDIRIQESKDVPPDFHPRKCVSVKTYRYQILNRKFALPTERLYSLFYYGFLDLEKMRAGAKKLIGEHDFQSFCSTGSQALTTVRTIDDIIIEKNQDMIQIEVTGRGFLYNMVRIIAGTLLQVGNGFLEPDRVEEILKAKDRNEAGPTAPAHGLCLLKIRYESI